MQMVEKKIFLISQPEVTNTVGGAITIFVNFCNLLVENGYKVYGICSNEIQGFPANLNKNVNFINLYYEYKEKNFSEAVNRMTKEIQPNLFIFFFNNLYEDANLSDEYDNIPRVLMFHSRPDVYFQGKYSVKTLELLYKNTVSQVLFASFKQLLPDFIKKGAVITIPNGIQITNKTINCETEHKKIIYLSRVDCCKGIEFLINSFKLIAKKYPNWSIDIYGQSQPPNYVNKLKQVVRKYNLENQIYFKGVTQAPLDTMLNYDFCVFPSFFEGFGIGLAEALSVGLPSIGLKKCSGVNELIIDNKNGFLTEDSYKDFAKKIEKLIKNKELRKTFSSNAINYIKKYDSFLINNKWLSIIKTILEDGVNSIKNNEDAVIANKKFFSIKIINDLARYSCYWDYKPYEYIFSIKETIRKTHTTITIFGFKFNINKKKWNLMFSNYKQRKE